MIAVSTLSTLTHQLCQVYQQNKSSKKQKLCKLQRLYGSNDCSVFVIAIAALGQFVGDIMFDRSMMRNHLLDCA